MLFFLPSFDSVTGKKALSQLNSFINLICVENVLLQKCNSGKILFKVFFNNSDDLLSLTAESENSLDVQIVTRVMKRVLFSRQLWHTCEFISLFNRHLNNSPMGLMDYLELEVCEDDSEVLSQGRRSFVAMTQGSCEVSVIFQ